MVRFMLLEKSSDRMEFDNSTMEEWNDGRKEEFDNEAIRRFDNGKMEEWNDGKMEERNDGKHYYIWDLEFCKSLKNENTSKPQINHFLRD